MTLKQIFLYSGNVNYPSEMYAAPLQTSTMELFVIIVGDINLKQFNFLAKTPMLDKKVHVSYFTGSMLNILLGPGKTFGFNAVLEIQVKIPS